MVQRLGALDPEALFYLRSRGVPEIEAQQLLMRAFADAVLSKITLPDVREHLSAMVRGEIGLRSEYARN